MKYLAALIIFGFQFGAYANSVCAQEEHYPIVSKADLKKIVAQNSAYIIDANGDESFNKSHVPGAVNFTKIEGSFASSLPQDKNALIVAYCGGPMCVAWKKAAEKACNLGYTNIKHFKEGITGWSRVTSNKIEN